MIPYAQCLHSDVWTSIPSDSYCKTDSLNYQITCTSWYIRFKEICFNRINHTSFDTLNAVLCKRKPVQCCNYEGCSDRMISIYVYLFSFRVIWPSRLFHLFECCKHTFTKGPLLFNSKFSKGRLCALLPVLRLIILIPCLESK